MIKINPKLKKSVEKKEMYHLAPSEVYLATQAMIKVPREGSLIDETANLKEQVKRVHFMYLYVTTHHMYPGMTSFTASRIDEHSSTFTKR